MDSLFRDIQQAHRDMVSAAVDASLDMENSAAELRSIIRGDITGHPDRWREEVTHVMPFVERHIKRVEAHLAALGRFVASLEGKSLTTEPYINEDWTGELHLARQRAEEREDA